MILPPFGVSGFRKNPYEYFSLQALFMMMELFNLCPLEVMADEEFS